MPEGFIAQRRPESIPSDMKDPRVFSIMAKAAQRRPANQPRRHLKIGDYIRSYILAMEMLAFYA